MGVSKGIGVTDSVPGVAIEIQLCSSDANVSGRTAAPTKSTEHIGTSFWAHVVVKRSRNGRFKDDLNIIFREEAKGPFQNELTSFGLESIASDPELRE
jgi:hypothetical protein